MFEEKFFIVGKGKVPDWFKDFCNKGRAKVNYDGEGDLVNIEVHSPGKKYIANVGDTILWTKSGLAVLPKVDNKAGKQDVENIEDKNTESE